jgi:hypothetical protein
MPTVFERGPYLNTAIFCERAIQERDGVLSLIRMIDKFITAVAGPGPVVPDQMPPVPVNLTLVVILKPGEARGRFTVKVRPEAPSGLRLPEVEAPVSFSGAPDAAANLLFNVNMIATEEGVYWFDILLDDQLLTRTPLRIEYSPLRTGVQTLPPG